MKDSNQNNAREINVQSGYSAGRGRLPIATRRKMKPRRNSLPVGLLQDATNVVSIAQGGKGRATQRQFVLSKANLSQQQQNPDPTLPSMSGCLSQKRNRLTNQRLVSYKSSGCKVTISTSTRSSNYVKNMYPQSRDNDCSTKSRTLPQTMRSSNHIPSVFGTKCQKTKMVMCEEKIEKKALDLKAKFEKKFVNASTFDCSFPMTSSPISQKDGLVETKTSVITDVSAQCTLVQRPKPQEEHSGNLPMNCRSINLKSCDPPSNTIGHDVDIKKEPCQLAFDNKGASPNNGMNAIYGDKVSSSFGINALKTECSKSDQLRIILQTTDTSQVAMNCLPKNNVNSSNIYQEMKGVGQVTKINIKRQKISSENLLRFSGNGRIRETRKIGFKRRTRSLSLTSDNSIGGKLLALDKLPKYQERGLPSSKSRDQKKDADLNKVSELKASTKSPFQTGQMVDPVDKISKREVQASSNLFQKNSDEKREIVAKHEHNSKENYVDLTHLEVADELKTMHSVSKRCMEADTDTEIDGQSKSKKIRKDNDNISIEVKLESNERTDYNNVDSDLLGTVAVCIERLEQITNKLDIQVTDPVMKWLPRYADMPCNPVPILDETEAEYGKRFSSPTKARKTKLSCQHPLGALNVPHEVGTIKTPNATDTIELTDVSNVNVQGSKHQPAENVDYLCANSLIKHPIKSFDNLVDATTESFSQITNRNKLQTDTCTTNVPRNKDIEGRKRTTEELQTSHCHLEMGMIKCTRSTHDLGMISMRNTFESRGNHSDDGDCNETTGAQRNLKDHQPVTEISHDCLLEFVPNDNSETRGSPTGRKDTPACLHRFVEVLASRPNEDFGESAESSNRTNKQLIGVTEEEIIEESDEECTGDKKSLPIDPGPTYLYVSANLNTESRQEDCCYPQRSNGDNTGQTCPKNGLVATASISEVSSSQSTSINAELAGRRCDKTLPVSTRMSEDIVAGNPGRCLVSISAHNTDICLDRNDDGIAYWSPNGNSTEGGVAMCNKAATELSQNQLAASKPKPVSNHFGTADLSSSELKHHLDQHLSNGISKLRSEQLCGDKQLNNFPCKRCVIREVDTPAEEVEVYHQQRSDAQKISTRGNRDGEKGKCSQYTSINML
ncbi:hypothetical protein LSH36_67g01026 [Paralvinella palmiformis]|uniref:Uncharacterized protein n=1 Tax=Paralvinella palmiformis TaxID=53620 RepID=A0AAD9K3F7_9ANNE|nr:hypothetical protein LSH36_67g01026 [Paralvinella palmiformis]